MNKEYESYEIYEAGRADLEESANKSSSNRAKRGALSIARFKIIGRLVWCTEDGLIAE